MKKVYILMGDTVYGAMVIVAAFDSREKAVRAMYLYDEDEFDDMWIKEMEVQ